MCSSVHKQLGTYMQRYSIAHAKRVQLFCKMTNMHTICWRTGGTIPGKVIYLPHRAHMTEDQLQRAYGIVLFSAVWKQYLILN